MAVPTFAFEISSDDLLTASPTWSDITTYGRAFQFTRGRERELEAVSVGKGKFVASAADRQLDPLNIGSSYYPLRPMTHARATMTLSGTANPVMRGFIDGYTLDWDVDWADSYAEVTFELVDAVSVMSASTISSGTSYSAESAEARITSILDDIGSSGWPAGLRRGIGTDGFSCLARTYTDTQNVWALAQEAMGTGFADRPLWVDAEGKITSGDGAESGIIFGDNGGTELTYTATTLEFNAGLLANNIRVTSDGFSGLSARSSTDPGPMSFGPRIYERSTLNVSDADCNSLADSILRLREYPYARPDSLIVKPGNDSTLWSAVLGLDVEDIITVIRRPPGGGDPYEQRFRISGVEWNVPRAVAGTTVTYRLAAAVFPTTAILDNFDRANEGPPPTGWTAWSNTGLKVVSNQCAPDDSGFNDAYWTTAMTGADVESYVTISTLPATGGATILFARTNPTAGGGGAGDGYAMVHDVSAGTDTITLRRYDLSVATTLDSWSLNLSAGDALGLRCLGTRIEAWVRRSGLWVLAGWATDSTHTGAAPKNKLGLFNSGNGTTAARYDNFGGGVVTS